MTSNQEQKPDSGLGSEIAAPTRFDDASGLSARMVLVLRLVVGRQAHTLGALAARLRISASAVSAVAATLEMRGLLMRSPHPTDRRSTLLQATDRGQAAADDLRGTNIDAASSYSASISTASTVDPLTPRACRRARETLRWGVERLGAECGLTGATVRRFEEGQPVKATTPRAIRTALEAAGIEFTHCDGPGVQLRKPAE